MDDFVFTNPTKIIFGKGAVAKTGDEVKKIASRVLLHYGKGSIKKNGVYDMVVRSLEEAGVDHIELSGAAPNPRLSLVKEGIELCRRNEIDFILAIGGGSAIDSAKAIAVGVPYKGDVWDFYDKKTEPEESLPIGVVLTIAAAGSESSKSSVITNEDGWYKKGLNVEISRPVFAVMDPEFTYSLPRFQTSCGVTDIIAHILERYFTNTTDVDLTDRMCEAVMKTVIRSALILNEEPENYAARADIMWAGSIAHNDLLSSGREGDWASHMIEHELSAIYDIAHGAGLAVIFPAWMRYVYRHDINRFVKFAHRVFDVDIDLDYPQRTAEEGIARLKRFFSDIGLPVSLKGLDIGNDRFTEMSSKATDNDIKKLGSFVKLGMQDVLNIYKQAE